ncbi:MAG: hypothetical protein ACQEXX_30860 [Bacillota bacterium]
MSKQGAMELEQFTCLGMPVTADETRSAAVCRNKEGEERLVIAARGYSLVVHPISGECQQLAFPDGIHEYPYAAMSGNDGLFYTGAGPYIYILDPFVPAYIGRFAVPSGEESAGFAFVESEYGHVYATTYPGSYLMKLDVLAGECQVVTRLDRDRKYAMSLAADRTGWVYVGLGTTSPALLCLRLENGLRKVIVRGQSGMIQPGSGRVFNGIDGNVYGWLPDGDDHGPGQWYRLHSGKSVSISEQDCAPSVYDGDGYKKLHGNLAGGRRLVEWELSDRQVSIQEPDGMVTVLPLHYDGGGTALSPIFNGPDGKLYGTSNHPLHFYTYDVDESRLVNHGSGIIERGGGGNIAAYALQGSKLMGAAYAGGLIHVLDTSKLLDTTSGSNRNPRLIYADDRIHRPRCAVSYADGRHVLYGGFPGYGAVGGGLGIVDLKTEQVTMLEHHQVVYGQSTVSLTTLSDGRIIGGSSIETPGGGEPIASEAVLYELNFSNRKVERQWIPIPEAREISQLSAGDDDLVYGLTSDSMFFIFDLSKGIVVYQQDLSSWGSVVRQGLIKTIHQGRPMVLGLLSRALFTVTPGELVPDQLAELPKEATCGIAYIKGGVYYGSGAELWRFGWGEE